MKHDIGPTPAEVIQFTSKSSVSTPAMRVTCRFASDLATRLDVDQVSFDVPAGFQLEQFVYSWNKDCRVIHNALINKQKDPAGVQVKVEKAGVLLMTFTGVYR